MPLVLQLASEVVLKSAWCRIIPRSGQVRGSDAELRGVRRENPAPARAVRLGVGPQYPISSLGTETAAESLANTSKYGHALNFITTACMNGCLAGARGLLKVASSSLLVTSLLM